MSKLPNAPLIEVIFELRWKYNPSKADLRGVVDSLYDSYRNEFPERETVGFPQIPGLQLPVEMAKYYFRQSPGGYPLLQVAPGVLSANATDETYYWDDFAQVSQYLLRGIPQGSEIERAFQGVTLKYLDFYRFDFSQGNAYDFLNEKVHFCVRDSAVLDAKPYNISIRTQYQIKCGVLDVNLRRGSVKGIEGIVMETSVIRDFQSLDSSLLKIWLEESHEVLSEYFKRITKGSLYESFK